MTNTVGIIRHQHEIFYKALEKNCRIGLQLVYVDTENAA